MKTEKTRIGLTLGSGGARGLAHIGVLKVLEEYQIPVDIVTGASMGAFIGGAFASGIKVSVMEELTLDADWKMTTRMFFPTISSSGFADGKRIKGFLKKVIGNRNIEELDRKFACVATDILTGEEIVIDRGSLIEAIRASISIPTILTPVLHGNRFLADGGIVNPVPVDLARRMGADIVIAVNVIPLKALPLKKEIRIDRDHKKPNNASAKNLKSKMEDLINISRISEIFKKEGKGNVYSPNFISMTSRTINILEREIIKLRLEKDRPDFLIEPDTSSTNMMEFYKGKASIHAGVKAALEIVPAIKKYLDRNKMCIQKELSP